jgi:hypothetical protein
MRLSSKHPGKFLRRVWQICAIHQQISPATRITRRRLGWFFGCRFWSRGSLRFGAHCVQFANRHAVTLRQIAPGG